MATNAFRLVLQAYCLTCCLSARHKLSVHSMSSKGSPPHTNSTVAHRPNRLMLDMGHVLGINPKRITQEVKATRNCDSEIDESRLSYRCCTCTAKNSADRCSLDLVFVRLPRGFLKSLMKTSICNKMCAAMGRTMKQQDHRRCTAADPGSCAKPDFEDEKLYLDRRYGFSEKKWLLAYRLLAEPSKDTLRVSLHETSSCHMPSASRTTIPARYDRYKQNEREIAETFKDYADYARTVFTTSMSIFEMASTAELMSAAAPLLLAAEGISVAGSFTTTFSLMFSLVMQPWLEARRNTFQLLDVQVAADRRLSCVQHVLDPTVYPRHSKRLSSDAADPWHVTDEEGVGALPNISLPSDSAKGMPTHTASGRLLKSIIRFQGHAAECSASVRFTLKNQVVHAHSRLQLAIGSARNFIQCLAAFQAYKSSPRAGQKSACLQAIFPSLFKIPRGLVTAIAARAWAFRRFLETVLSPDSYEAILGKFLERLTDGMTAWDDVSVDLNKTIGIFGEMLDTVESVAQFPCTMMAHFLQETADILQTIHKFFYVHAASMDKVWSLPATTDFLPSHLQKTVKPCMGHFKVMQTYNPEVVDSFCPEPVATPCVKALNYHVQEYSDYMAIALCCSEASEQSTPWA